MKWAFWLSQYLELHCTARGLSARTIQAYRATLEGFCGYVQFRLGERGPDELSPRDLLEYVEYLRRERRNGAAAVNRQVTVLKGFYRAMVALGYLEDRANPMAHFPKIKAAPCKLPVFLNHAEVQALLAVPSTDTVLGLRDRALLTLLYGTGIRASECALLREGDVNLPDATIRVLGKGGHERVLPLNCEVVRALAQYRQARGPLAKTAAFFRSRNGRGLTRYAIFERVRRAGRKARLTKTLSPHRLRHTCATHLVRRGVDLITIRDLLGHRCVTSTQVYLHTTAEDLRQAALKHPVEALIRRIEDLLPDVALAFQRSPAARVAGDG
jgi:integrase/recombinase XerD